MFNSARARMRKLQELVALAEDHLKTPPAAVNRIVMNSLRLELVAAVADVWARERADGAGPPADVAERLREAEAFAEALERHDAQSREAKFRAHDERGRLDHAAVDRVLGPCRECGAIEVFIDDAAVIESPGPRLDVRLIVCGNCGDLRMQVCHGGDVRAWARARAMRHLTLPPRERRPYRD